MEVLPYRFKPDLSTDGNITLSLPSSLLFHLKLKFCRSVDCVGNTDWHVCFMLHDDFYLGQLFICDCILEKPPVMHKDKY